MLGSLRAWGLTLCKLPFTHSDHTWLSNSETTNSIHLRSMVTGGLCAWKGALTAAERSRIFVTDLLCKSSLQGQCSLQERVIDLHVELLYSSYSLGHPRRSSVLQALANQVSHSLDLSLHIIIAKWNFMLNLVTKTDSDSADQILTMKRKVWTPALMIAMIGQTHLAVSQTWEKGVYVCVCTCERRGSTLIVI